MPQQISEIIKIDYLNNDIRTISHEAIYRHIYTIPHAALNKKINKLITCKKQDIGLLKKRRGTDSKIINQVSIDKRLKHIDDRQEIGHWEGDLNWGKP